MSVRQLDRVLRFSVSKGSARLVLIALADVANDEGEVSAYHRSHSALGRKANVDGATVRRSIAKLVELGEVEILAMGDGRRSTDYRLHVPEGVQIAAPHEGVQVDTPGGAACLPRGGEMPPLGVQADTPIIPSSSVDDSVPVQTTLLAVVPPVPGSPSALDLFDRWWGLYPADRRTGKGDAHKAWNAVVKAGAYPAAIVEGLERYVEETASWSPSDRRFIKTPAPWLRGQRWLDEPGSNLRRGGPGNRPVVDNRTAPSGRVSAKDL